MIGRGPLNPKYLFVGVNPGKEEIKKGDVFVGPSGRLLDRWIEFLGIKKEEYAITNLIKCHTNNESELKGDEVKNCLPFLKEQIEILKPEYIIMLGAKPAHAILGDKRGITSIQGKIFRKEKVYYIPLTHPAYWLRNGGKGWEPMLNDFKLILDGESIIEKPSGLEGIREVTPFLFKEDPIEIETPTTDQEYVPLHVHTTYSVTDGVAQIDELVETAKKMGFSALAITDHGAIGGWVDFQLACEKAGIKPILGVEFYAVDDYANKNSDRLHVVALAKNEKGIKNIFKLNAKAQDEGFYYKPRILIDDLLEQSDGLVILSACVSGIIASPAISGKMHEAIINLKKLHEMFGEDFYLELQPHSFKEQKKANPLLIDLAEKHEIGMVLTTDVHYVKKEGKKAHDALLAIVFRKKMGEAGFSIDTNYLMNSSELRELSKNIGIPDDVITKCFLASKEIADKCNAKLKRYENALPGL